MNTITNKPDTEALPDFLNRATNGVTPASKTGPAKAATLTSTPPVEGKAQAVERVEQPAATKTKPSKRQAQADATKHIAKAKPAKAAKTSKAKAVSAATDKPAPEKRSIVPASFKARYAEHNDTCGSTLSLALKDATSGVNKDKRPCLLVPELFAIAKANGIDTKPYAGLNNGQKRMNVYNRLVGLLNDGTDVRVGKRVFRAADHKPTTNKPAKKAAKAKAKAQPAQQHASA